MGGNATDGARHVKEPVWCHREKSQEHQEEEEAVRVLLNLKRYNIWCHPKNRLPQKLLGLF